MGLCQHLVYACAIILALWWWWRFAANCSNRYIYHELLSDCQENEHGSEGSAAAVAEMRRGGAQAAAGDRFCSGYHIAA